LLIEKETFQIHVFFFLDGGVVADVGDVAAVHVGFVGFEDDEFERLESMLDERSRFRGAARGFAVDGECGGVDAAQTKALGGPDVEAEVDADEERVAVDDVFDDGFVDVEWIGAAGECVCAARAGWFGGGDFEKISANGVAKCGATPGFFGGARQIKTAARGVFEGDEFQIMRPA